MIYKLKNKMSTYAMFMIGWVICLFITNDLYFSLGISMYFSCFFMKIEQVEDKK